MTTTTGTTLTGFLKGNGANVSAAAAVALGTEVTGILPSTSHPALTGDVTTTSGSVATTVARLGGGTAFSTITYGSATTATIPNLAGNGTATATATVTGCAGTNHLLITESSYSVNQAVIVKSATCSAVDTATITFLNATNGALSGAGTLTFKYMLIRP